MTLSTVCLKEFYNLIQSLETLRQKRIDIIKRYGMTDDAIVMKDLVNHNDDVLEKIKIKLENTISINNELVDILKLRQELIQINIDELNQETLASSYIFEHTLIDDLLDDLKYLNKRD